MEHMATIKEMLEEAEAFKREIFNLEFDYLRPWGERQERLRILRSSLITLNYRCCRLMEQYLEDLENAS